MDNVFDYNRLGNRFNKIVSLLIIIVLSFLIFYFVTYSWFGESEVGSKVVVIGDIELVVETELAFPNDLLEPNKIYENMPTTITCAEGTDEAFIKVKLETDYKVKSKNADGELVDTHVIKPVLFVSDEMTAQGKQSWYHSEIDDYYYYVGYIGPDIVATFNTGMVVTNDINNIDRNQPVNIKITICAIQRHFKSYEFEPEWAYAPAEWKTEIAQYDVVN